MENTLENKVKEQREAIQYAVVSYKSLISTIRSNSRMYTFKELDQKVTILQGFIDILEDIKI